MDESGIERAGKKRPSEHIVAFVAVTVTVPRKLITNPVNAMTAMVSAMIPTRLPVRKVTTSSK